MSAWEAIILGLVQGFTEFLPVSSSAQLRIVGELIGGADPGALFTAVTQIGTEVAVLLYYRRAIRDICVGWWTSLRGDHGTTWRDRFGAHDADARMAWYIALGSLPIVVLGVLFDEAIETTLRNLWITVATLVVFGVLLDLADRYGRRTRVVEDLTPKRAIGYGLAQALALIPGVSRSGGTITAGLAMGFTRRAAADYSFLLAIPAVLGSGFYQLAKAAGGDPAPGSAGWGATLIATLVAFALGYVVLIGFLKIVSTYSYKPFVYYRYGLAVLVVVLILTGVLEADPAVTTV
ncbi:MULTISPECIES: undecaprenyl-diphosphatase UppP [unclassified Isoptericola]|uniref:undecaprenyl-diphosphatase UppP n=1 Tax=unclassified Isoptericola TaxID=2623355 RepID=UPI002712B16A|nr:MULTISPECIES: undecaprenyl-diphosphatase UppP [unclassified Isoptericola]MDO8145000.1 undecaprenyl-diphosphatase UppP [Isoptericola sp. 178]MDO8148633.1 undecaprenyl-diphosphatase UppP [Isoptericola sp. b515]MDO8151421.1 undecaprenyl-diphosphatase UppP [Isoptericola sp. b408]